MPMSYKPEEKYRRYYQSIEPLLAKPKNRAYTATVFSFLAVSLFGWYGIRPTLQTILTLRREIADNTVVSRQMEEKIVNLIQAQATYQSIENKLPFLEESVPGNPDVLPIVFQLRNLANATNASISAISVPTTPLLGQEATPGAQKIVSGKPIEIPVVVSVSGSFESIKTFLDGVLSMRRLAVVDTVNIVPEEVTEEFLFGPRPLRLILKLTTFYMPSADTR